MRTSPPRTHKLPPAAVTFIFALLLLALMAAALLLGRYPLTMEGSGAVLLRIRLPRILMAALVGACLSAAGSAYQGVFQNPMAAPDILGATQGSAFGAALAILLGAPRAGVAPAAFLSGLAAVALVWYIGNKTTGKRVLGLILTGIVVGSLFSAATSFVKLAADPYDQLPAITYWLMGSLVGTKMSDVIAALLPAACGLLPLHLLRWRMNIITLGDEEAHSLGVDPHRMRQLIVLSSTLITATAVSAAGMIGWVGLVVPHAIRKLVGSDYRYLLPGSMLGGASFLLVVDSLARFALTREIPIGILTALMGAPVFLYLITAKEERL